jgi:hypothetical protein
MQREEDSMTNVTTATRRGRLLLIVVTAVAALVLALWIGVARAADPRLDEADLALQKAEGLLEAAQSGSTDTKVQHRFDRAVARAIGNVERARARIVDAKDAVDNP